MAKSAAQLLDLHQVPFGIYTLDVKVSSGPDGSTATRLVKDLSGQVWEMHVRSLSQEEARELWPDTPLSHACLPDA
jgi:hypothetical protein